MALLLRLISNSRTLTRIVSVHPYWTCYSCHVAIPCHVINIVYVIESAVYGVLFMSCLCQQPERARYERVRAFDTNNE